jgi:hypothetical protein
MRAGRAGGGRATGDELPTRFDDTRARVVDERNVGTYRRHVNNLT